jgi:uncharacterized protein (TIGR02145 family)
MLLAQVPESINYQAIVRNGTGEAIVSQQVSYKFSILKGSTSGTIVYSEKHRTTTTQFGLIILIIGSGTDKIGDFTSIEWGGDIYFLKSEVDLTGGINYMGMGTTQLLSVLYAIYAKDINIHVSPIGDTLFIGNEKYVIVPSISAANPNLPGNLMTDLDGNIYQTVTIGTQIWMAQNLKTTHYRDGSAVSNVTDELWNTLTTGVYVNYNNSNDSETYSKIYNGFAATDSRFLCPTGWHLPASNDLSILLPYLGGSNGAGNKLKEAGTTHWLSQNTGATNESGFTTLPGGNYESLQYNGLRNSGFWWMASSSASNPDVNGSSFTYE